MTASYQQPTGRAEAFTLTELLVIIAVLLLLAVVTLPAWLGNQEQVLRARCVSNLREIGAGLNVYSVEAADYFPVCGWQQGQNPWPTYTAARVIPGTSTLTRGFMNLGLLFRIRIAPDPKTFYCPGLDQSNPAYGYDYYASPSTGWPSTPVGSGDEQIRTGYNYYPQLRATVQTSGYTLPRLIFASYSLEVGGTFTLVAPAKWAALNPQKSIVTDVVHDAPISSHRAYGSVAGLNALFPDGAVAFQNTRDPQAFDPALWTLVGSDPLKFRRAMNNWKQ